MLRLMMRATERQLRTLGAASGHRSIRALCIAADIDRTSLYRTIARGRRPRRSTVARLAAALNVDADVVARIFGGEP